jgi:hypothetical protein
MSAESDLAIAQAKLVQAQADEAAVSSAVVATSTAATKLTADLAALSTELATVATDLGTTPPPPPPVVTPLVLAAITPISGTVGTAITAISLSASGGTTPYTYTVSPALPAGLSLIASTIAGIPTTAVVQSNFVVKVTDASSPQLTESQTLSITVAAAVTPPPPPPSGVAAAKLATTGGPPAVRGEPGGCLHPGTGLLYYVCGNDQASGALGDMWSLNPATGAWVKLAATVPGNVAVSINYDPITKTLIMFGGDNGDVWFNTTYSLDPTLASPAWTKLNPATSPPTRSGHCGFNDPITGVVMIYGGNQAGNPNALDDCWKWTGATWVEVSSAFTGTGRTGAFSATDTELKETMIFGGNGSSILNDTHIWNGTTCTKANPATSPPGRRFGGCASNNAGQTLIYGGCNIDFSVNESDCWIWNGTTWTEETPSGLTIGGLSSQVMNFHPATGKFFMAFGTAGASASSESTDINTVYEFTVGGSVTPPVTVLSITTASLPGGIIGTAYSATLVGSGGSGTKSWSATGLPVGLVLSIAGVLSGIPTTAATYSSVTVTLKDSANDTPALSTFTIVVAPASVTPPPPVTGAPILGLYIGGAGAAPVQAFAETLGVTCQAFGEYTTRSVWSDIAGSGWVEDGADGMRLIVGVGLVPTGVSLTAVPANVSNFATLAASLAPGTICRLGWEFDGGWYAWGINYPGNTPASYAAAWQAVVPAMKAVQPGLLFDFCSNAGSTQTMAELEAYYPGDAYVDYIGCDHYDNTGGGGSPTPMAPVIELAAARGKPFSCGEWGLNGADNPTFINEMAQVFLDPSAAAAKWGWPTYTVAYQSYFSADLSINSTLNTTTPNSLAAYKAAFAGE